LVFFTLLVKVAYFEEGQNCTIVKIKPHHLFFMETFECNAFIMCKVYLYTGNGCVQTYIKF